LGLNIPERQQNILWFQSKQQYILLTTYFGHLTNIRTCLQNLK
jgi:hypothetical protein